MRPDVERARFAARSILMATVMLTLVLLFLWVAAPGFPRGGEPPWYEHALPWFGACGYLIGLAWMVRIYRTSHVEPETSSWRYRDVSGEPRQP